MTDEPHMDETRPDQAIPTTTLDADPDAEGRPEPQTFADLPIQPTGSGVADQAIAYEQMVVDAAEGDDEPLADDAVDPTRPLR